MRYTLDNLPAWADEWETVAEKDELLALLNHDLWWRDGEALKYIRHTKHNDNGDIACAMDIERTFAINAYIKTSTDENLILETFASDGILCPQWFRDLQEKYIIKERPKRNPRNNPLQKTIPHCSGRL